MKPFHTAIWGECPAILAWLMLREITSPVSLHGRRGDSDTGDEMYKPGEFKAQKLHKEERYVLSNWGRGRPRGWVMVEEAWPEAQVVFPRIRGQSSWEERFLHSVTDSEFPLQVYPEGWWAWVREAHSSSIFCAVFHISSAVGTRSRNIWKFLFYICMHLLVRTITCKSGKKCTLCAVGSQQCCAGERKGSELGWLCVAGDHVTEGDTSREPVSPRPQRTKQVRQIPPLQLVGTWALLNHRWSEYFWGSNLVLNPPNGWLLHLDPQRGAGLCRYPCFLPKCVCLCVSVHTCVYICQFSFKHLVLNSNCRDFQEQQH